MNQVRTIKSVTARELAFQALKRIELTSSYANIVLPSLLDTSDLADRDKRFVTELVYGTTRYQRSCDWLIDRYIFREIDSQTRIILRLGAYQIIFLQTPAHAAVDATVSLAPRKTRGFVNAILRKIAGSGVPKIWPSPGVELSYPDWIISSFTEEFGQSTAFDLCRHMNTVPPVHQRDDGYIQDIGSQMVVDSLDAKPTDIVLDACAAPGGKATLLGQTAFVVASDLQVHRVKKIQENIINTKTKKTVHAVVADITHPPYKTEFFDKVLLDAPCSGLGTLRRRADARWRIQPDDVDRLAEKQKTMLLQASKLVKPGGLLLYSVCTLSSQETKGIDDYAKEVLTSWEILDDIPAPWQRHGRGWILLPTITNTDGMYILGLRRPNS